MTSKLVITSQFAILDVKQGRKSLAKWFRQKPRGPGPCQDRLRIPVTIFGYIDGEHSHDDGESQEFTIEVKDVAILTNRDGDA